MIAQGLPFYGGGSCFCLIPPGNAKICVNIQNAAAPQSRQCFKRHTSPARRRVRYSPTGGISVRGASATTRPVVSPHTPPKRRSVSDRWPDEPVAHPCSALPCKQLFVLVCRDLQLFSRVFRRLLFQFQHMIHAAFQRFPAEGVSFQRHIAVGAALLRDAE